MDSESEQGTKVAVDGKVISISSSVAWRMIAWEIDKRNGN